MKDHARRTAYDYSYGNIKEYFDKFKKPDQLNDRLIGKLYFMRAEFHGVITLRGKYYTCQVQADLLIKKIIDQKRSVFPEELIMKQSFGMYRTRCLINDTSDIRA